MRIITLVALLGAVYASEPGFGVWKLNPARSTFTGDVRPKDLTVRIEPHPKGEVFTLDRIEADGRATSSSTILYFDGAPRDFQDFGCSGTQSSRRLDSGTVEILRKCGSDEWIRFIRRSAPSELTLEITEQHSNGHRFERRLALEKQSVAQNK